MAQTRDFDWLRSDPARPSKRNGRHGTFIPHDVRPYHRRFWSWPSGRLHQRFQTADTRPACRSRSLRRPLVRHRQHSLLCKLTDVYNAHPKSFDAPLKSFTLTGYVVPGTGNAKWRESPFWPLYLSYLILYVDPDYQTALVGYPGQSYGWVFARKPVIDEASYQSLLGRMRDQGYDIGQFRRVPQTPSQIGNPGFQ